MLPPPIQSFCETIPVELTAIRTTLLEHLWQNRQPVKAYSLIGVLREKGIGAPKPATVYRALAYLAEFGLIHKVHTLNAYVPCSHPGKHQNCQLFMCDGCASAQEFCDVDLRSVQLKNGTENIAALSFIPRTSIVEVYGICGTCQKAEPC